jgi:hypothetical protein
MGIFDAMINLVSRPTGKIEAAKSLSFPEAIEAHIKWRDRLHAAIHGTSDEINKIDPAVIACDDKCVLGKWIHGEGLIGFKRNGNFKALRKHHALFHQHASVIVEKIQNGKAGHANMILHGVFVTESRNVVELLEKLGEKYATEEQPDMAQ